MMKQAITKPIRIPRKRDFSDKSLGAYILELAETTAGLTKFLDEKHEICYGCNIKLDHAIKFLRDNNDAR